MRTSPSIVPHAVDQDIYLVLDNTGWNRDGDKAKGSARKAAGDVKDAANKRTLELVRCKRSLAKAASFYAAPARMSSSSELNRQLLLHVKIVWVEVT
jgi:hypothetical protein